MEIHTFRAASLQEALMLVRHQLGPEASVLHTREVAGKFFGLLGKRSIEVQASRDAKVLRRLAGDGINGSVATPSALASTALATTALATTALESTVEPHSEGSLDLSEMDHQVSSASRLLDSTRHASDGDAQLHGVPAQVYSAQGYSARATRATIAPLGHQISPAMFEVFTEMLDADVEPEAARTMLQEVANQCMPQQLGDAWFIKGRLCQLIQQRVNVAGPIDLSSGARQVVALIGPTGVGKTTTLAKLAAGFHFDQGTSVGFLTLDTFRLGAVDQLQKYADLLGAPCEVVSAPDQMRSAIERLNHCQLILIDTAGRSPRDSAQLDTLSDFLRQAEPTQTHLVLSAASSQSHAQMAFDQFAALEPTHLLLTKLDESTCLGSWYRLLTSGTWPLSYLTTGQHVPEDILVANRRRVASLIIGQTSHFTWK